MTDDYLQMIEWFNNLGQEWTHHIDWFWGNWCLEGNTDKDDEYSDEFIWIYKRKYGHLAAPPSHEETWG